MPARDAEKAQLGLPVGRDDAHGDANRTACLADEGVPIGRLPHGLGGAGDEDLEAVAPRLLDHGLKRPDRDLGPRTDGAGARHVRSELRLLHIVGDVFELSSHDVGDQRVHGVAADVNSRKAHLRLTLSGPLKSGGG